MKPVDLRIMNGLKSGSFIGTDMPLFSWRLEASAGTCQHSYRIVAASAPELLPEHPDLWDSGRIQKGESLYIQWQGKALESRQRVFWRVMVWDREGLESDWSETAEFEIALLGNSEWSAEWIYFDGNNPSHSAPCPYLRKEFSVNKEIKCARLYVTARGLYEMSFNGKRVGEDYFVPGWTDFAKQIQYMSYDVGNLLQPGVNAVGAILGDGWYCGYLSGRRRNIYGDTPQLLAQLEITYRDGSRETIVSDNSWSTATGPILYSDIYDGEMYDARLEMPGWDTAGFDTAKWRRAVSAGQVGNSPELAPKCCLPVRKMREIKPVQILRPREDVCIFDLGQNISGWVRIKLKGHSGRLYTFHFGEMLNQDGTLYNLNYRSARSTDYYTCKGDMENGEVWEPRFTFHGFRYVEIDSYMFAGANLEPPEVTGVVLYSELEETGSFECSEPLVNQLYSNICWGQRDNFFEIPTDCPQRDERLGWTGDAQVFIPAATFNMNVSAFFEKWLRDVRDCQLENGAVPAIAPDILGMRPGAAAWADAMVICPWVIYQSYGNPQILAQNYEAMKKWVDYQKNTSNNLIRESRDFGDWLALSPVETPHPLIGTAYFAYTAELVAKTAAILGHADDAEYYRTLSRQVKIAFGREFIAENGQIEVHSQTACILALQFELLESEQRRINVDLLGTLIEQAGGKLTTGFVGTGLIMPALTSGGQTGAAYGLLLQQEYPSWLFSVLQGATTIWERWNSYTIENGFGDVNMNSFNHYSYGAVASWMAQTVLGIQLDETAPGGRKIIFAAVPDKRLAWVKGGLKMPYGQVRSSWQYTDNQWRWQISCPPNTSAKVILPFELPATINGKPVSGTEFELENGEYEITLSEKG